MTAKAEAYAVFGDGAEAWLQRPNRFFDSMTPLEVAQSPGWRPTRRRVGDQPLDPAQFHISHDLGQSWNLSLAIRERGLKFAADDAP